MDNNDIEDDQDSDNALRASSKDLNHDEETSTLGWNNKHFKGYGE